MKLRAKFVSWLGVIVLWALGLASCRAGLPLATVQEIEPREVRSTEVTPEQWVSSTPVLVPLGERDDLPPESALAAGKVSSVLGEQAEVLSFAFPANAESAPPPWRPPLYPVPWEPTPCDHFYLSRPIGANEAIWPLANYRYGYLFYSEPHSGIDIPSPKGTPVLAAGPGVVIWAGWGLYFLREEYRDPYGIAVAIRHDFGYQGKTIYTVYGHLDQVFVYRGERVESGKILGVVGETGKTSGPHLHFEVRVGDNTFFVTKNPELWIAPSEGTGVLVGRILNNDGEKAPRVKVKLRSQENGRTFEVLSYAKGGAINSDDFYDENLVLSGIPSGTYMIFVESERGLAKGEVIISAGQVTFITYKPKDGIQTILPSCFPPWPTPSVDMLTPWATPVAPSP